MGTLDVGHYACQCCCTGQYTGGPTEISDSWITQGKGEDLEQLDYDKYIDKTVCHSKLLYYYPST